jgi:hypothetical protein
VAPRLAAVVPLSDAVVIGATATGRFFRGYVPRADMTDPYVPGASLRLGLGADLRLTPTSALSGDVAATTYGTDTVGGRRQLTLGSALTATVQYLNRFDFNRFRVVAQYQTRRPSTFYAGSQNATSVTDLRVRPRESFAQAGLRVRLVPDLYGTVRLRGSLFRATSRQPRLWAGRLVLRPAWTLAERWTVSGRLRATLGNLRGIGGGLGLSVAL